MKLPKFEYLIIGVCFFAFVFFTMKKCSATQSQLSPPDGSAISTDTTSVGEVAATTDPENTAASSRSLQNDLRPAANTAPSEAAVDDTPVKSNSNKPTKTPSNRPSNEEPTAPASEAQRSEGTRLYTISEGVNVRTEPSLTAKSLGKLPLYDEVTFMGKVSENTTELSIGKTVVRQPWVQIKTKRGTIGWVFGAYVSYYKKKDSATW